MILQQLLWFVPRFNERLSRSFKATRTVVTNITIPDISTNVINLHCPKVDMIIQGHKITGSLIDGGSRVNVITTDTCERLGITRLCSTTLDHYVIVDDNRRGYGQRDEEITSG